MARFPTNPKEARLVNVTLGSAFLILNLIDLFHYHVLTSDWKLFTFTTALFGFFMLVGSITGGLFSPRHKRRRR